MNKLQRNSNQNTKLFTNKNPFENVCEMVTILSKGRLFEVHWGQVGRRQAII